MLDTYAFTPYFLLLIALVVHAFLLIKYASYPDDYNPSKRWKIYLYDFFMYFGFSIFFAFGVLYLDTAIIWLLGQTAYSDWIYQLPSVILLIILGVQYTIGAFFVKPRKFDLVFAIASTVIILLFSHIFISSIEIGFQILIYYFELILLLAFIYALLSIILNKKIGKDRPYLYDKSREFKKIFSKPFNIILYILMSVNVWMNFLGYSLIFI